MALICVPTATIVQEDIKPMRTSRIASPFVGIVLIAALAGLSVASFQSAVLATKCPHPSR